MVKQLVNIKSRALLFNSPIKLFNLMFQAFALLLQCWLFFSYGLALFQPFLHM